MNILHSSRRQRGASAWTMVGGLLVVVGMAGLGVALIKPGSTTASIASATSAATRSGAAAPMTADTKPAAPAAAPTAVIKPAPQVPARIPTGTALGGAHHPIRKW